MAKKIKVTPLMLETAAGKIGSMSEDYKSLYNQLYSKTGTLISTWKGRDNVAFINKVNGFKKDFEKMKALMDAYSDFLKKSAKAYRDTQTALEALARKLQ